MRGLVLMMNQSWAKGSQLLRLPIVEEPIGRLWFRGLAVAVLIVWDILHVGHPLCNLICPVVHGGISLQCWPSIRFALFINENMHGCHAPMGTSLRQSGLGCGGKLGALL